MKNSICFFIKINPIVLKGLNRGQKTETIHFILVAVHPENRYYLFKKEHDHLFLKNPANLCPQWVEHTTRALYKMNENEKSIKPILVTGATGYVGGRLVPLLLGSGYRVRAMSRSLQKLQARPWANHPHMELIKADALDAESLSRAVRGCRAIYYLVHSMNSETASFAETDRRAAQNMVEAASKEGVERMIYLGGLGETNHAKLSRHLRSRHEVAAILQAGKVPTTVLRAAVILGSGSVSFEIMRYLVERLPVMITPKWVNTLNQPIAIRNVLFYLRGCLETDEVLSQSFDIGGPDILTYRELFDIYAEEAGLPKRRIIPIPLLSLVLSSYWLHFITPVPSPIARSLAAGLRNEVICHDHRIRRIIPQPLLSCREAIQIALERIRENRVDTCWSDAGCLAPPEWVYCGDEAYSGGDVLQCAYRVRLSAYPEDIWHYIIRIGGNEGWYFGSTLWRLRGLLDRWIGGVGLQRGRRDPDHLRVGDALDFWRVLEANPPNRLLLLAEMKSPGDALLDIRIDSPETEVVELQLIARFLPSGLGGLIYWYTLYPFHFWLFRGMLRSIARNAGKTVLAPPHRFSPHTGPICELDPSQQ
jgi:uncharacterized protein YbjT (DUF2867 family)